MAEEDDIKVSKVSNFLFRFLTYPKLPIPGRAQQSSQDLILEDARQCPYYSQLLHLIVELYCMEFHGLFENFLKTRCDRPCKNHLLFVSYAVTNCRDFMNRDFGVLMNKIGQRNITYFFMIMNYVLITELLYFFMKRNCYKYLSYGPTAFRVVYKRYLKKHFLAAHGWEGFKAHCEKTYEEYLAALSKAKQFKYKAIPASIVAFHTDENYVVEIRKRLEYSINYFSVKSFLTPQEKCDIGNYPYNMSPCDASDTETCRVCRFYCRPCPLLYLNSY